MSKLYEALQKAERERRPTVETIETERRPVISKELTQSRESIQEKPADRSISVAEPNLIAAEEFRKLRTLIFQSSISKPMQTLLVTSAVPGEGKSTVASNLARAISQGDKEHALLIDCDLRNFHKNPLLRGNTPLGLSDYLMDKLDLASLIVMTETPKLSVVPSGPIISNPAELLGSEKMKKLINTLKSRDGHRYIIIDSPPILLTTDPIVLSEMADWVILVVRSGKTSREAVQRAVKDINKEKILGIVLNQIKAKPSYYRSSGYYYPQKRD